MCVRNVNVGLIEKISRLKVQWSVGGKITSAFQQGLLTNFNMSMVHPQHHWNMFYRRYYKIISCIRNCNCLIFCFKNPERMVIIFRSKQTCSPMENNFGFTTEKMRFQSAIVAYCSPLINGALKLFRPEDCCYLSKGPARSKRRRRKVRSTVGSAIACGSTMSDSTR